jgi:hypothetical protein
MLRNNDFATMWCRSNWGHLTLTIRARIDRDRVVSAVAIARHDLD